MNTFDLFYVVQTPVVTKSEPKPAKPVKTKTTKRDKKSKEKSDEAFMMVDAKFNLVDDSIKKDVSKIKEKREYDATKKTAVEWSFQNVVKEDGPNVKGNILPYFIQFLYRR